MQNLLAEYKGDISTTNLAEMGDKKGADVKVSLYHAFDGRTWEGPLYMATGEGGAMSLLKYRFSKDQVEAAGADPKWIGKRVWHSEPQPVEAMVGNVLCRFSVRLPEGEKKALEVQGFRAFCQNPHTFLTEAAEDLHARKRHPQWYAFQEKKVAATTAAKNASSQEAQTAALIALVERLTAENKAG